MKKIVTVVLAFLIFLGPGCKKYLDVNDDRNNPTDVQESLILPASEFAVINNIEVGVAAQNLQLYLQVMAQNQPTPSAGTYRAVNGDADGDWNAVYGSLVNLKILNDKAEADGKINYAAVSRILTAYVLGFATDIWGDIPYSQGLQGNANFIPAYDSQEDIYKSIQRLLSESITLIAQQSPITPGSDDYFYGGDMAKWSRLAYTLKARNYIHLTKAPGYTREGQADSALLALNNAMQSNDDDLSFSFPGAAGQQNPWFLAFNPVGTQVLASTFIDSLKARNDPRLRFMVAPAEGTGLYTGRVIGSDIGDLESYSYPSDFYQAPGATMYLVSYSEALFIKAEATLIKSGSSAAESIYQDAIKAHMNKLGVPAGGISSYLSSRGTLLNDNALQRIIEEKNVANFLHFENFTDWRRTGFPKLTKVQNALSDIPRRWLYPQIEITTNPRPQQSAKLTDRVWWDQ